ncbi:MAG: transposase [Deltaproteobacteria bacterium]|nr:transposase [Deltaproteobacteria bacterium]
MRQLALLPKPSLEHGSSLRTGKRKIARPIDTKRAMHLVMRATRARGPWSMLREEHKPKIERLVHLASSRHGVRVYRFSNVGNHLHLLVRARTRVGFQNFLRVITAQTAALATGARKGNPKGRFWDALAYSRVVSWGREFKKLQAYLSKNLLEGMRLFLRGPRGSWTVLAKLKDVEAASRELGKHLQV